MADTLINFAKATIATAPSPATTGTSLVLGSGEGADLPTPPWSAILCPIGEEASKQNAEIIRCTAKSGDTLTTITRAQESTTARTWAPGDRLYIGPTATYFNDIWTSIGATQLDIAINYINKAVFNNKGELIGSSAADTVSLIPAGSVNGHALVRASGAASGNQFSGSLDRDLGQNGLFLPQWSTSYATLTPTANRALYVRFCPSRDMAITAIAFIVNTAGGGADQFDVGIYTFSGSSLTRVASSGAQTSATVGGALNATAGVRSMNLSSTANLNAGQVYYAALSFGTLTATAVVIVATNTVSTAVMDIFGTAVGTQLGFFKATSHPLGAGPISTFTVTNQIPILALRE